MKKVVYPKLTPFTDFGFIRISGPGLANCMMISARAYSLANKNNHNFINPTWNKVSVGPYLRKEKDKRHYFGLFNILGISGFKKLAYIFLFYFKNKNIILVDSLGGYFEDLKKDHELVKKYFNSIINKNKLKNIEKINFKDVIGVHIRLGDYKNTTLETKIDFYLNLVFKIKELHKNKYKIYIFSDANDEELRKVLEIDGVKKVFFGNALADLIALSKCKLIVGSDSTFSGLASFINQAPIIFPKRHFDSPLFIQEKEIANGLSVDHETLEDFLMDNL